MTSGPGRFLLVTWAGGGNVQPLVALGVELRARGHEVRVLAPMELASRFEDDGIGFAGDASNLAAVLDADRAEVAVVDYMLCDALSEVEHAGRPLAAFVHTLYRRQAVADHSPMHMGGDTSAVNGRRAVLGLDPVERVPDLLHHADLVLVTTTDELDDWHDPHAEVGPGPGTPVPDNVRFVGPLVEGPGRDGGWSPATAFGTERDRDDRRPLVVVSMGTTPMGEGPVVSRIVEALGSLPVRVLVTVRAGLDLGGLGLPDNTVVSGYVRHAAVLPYARLFVNHGGMSGIGAGLTSGVPMVCVPLGRDQPDNAVRVEAIGAGRVASAGASAGELRAVFAGVLANDAMAVRTAQVAASIARSRPVARAADELEALR